MVLLEGEHSCGQCLVQGCAQSLENSWVAWGDKSLTRVEFVENENQGMDWSQIPKEELTKCSD